MEKLKENILSWCSNMEPAARMQAENLSVHPCLYGNVCLMPDAHSGYGMPIGGVAALDNAISPNMVGVDIGCGMLAVQTSLEQMSREKIRAAVDKIYARVPLGFDHHQYQRSEQLGCERCGARSGIERVQDGSAAFEGRNRNADKRRIHHGTCRTGFRDGSRINV